MFAGRAGITTAQLVCINPTIVNQQIVIADLSDYSTRGIQYLDLMVLVARRYFGATLTTALVLPSLLAHYKTALV